MTTRKRITDYPAIFWAALIATIVGGWMSVHAYKAMIHADDALIRSIGMFVVLECVSIFAAATMNTRGQGLLVGLAFVLIFGCAGTEIFLGASELQRGVMQMTETAKAASASTANGTANASALATAQEGLKGCQTRYPRKKKDAQARTECAKPYEKSIAALTAGEPAKAVAFDPEAAGMLALWQGITDAYNTMMGKEGEEAAKVEQVAFIAMLSIFTVFVIGKLFLWSKYAAWKTANYGDDYQAPNAVTVPEHAIGNPASVAESIADNNDEPEAQPAKMPFGFTGNKSPAASSADRNRAQMQAVEKSQFHDRNTGYRNTGNDRVRDTVDGKPYTGNDCITEIRYTGIEAVKAAKVGQTVNCPVCGTAFVKANKWHLFCSNSRKKKNDGTSCADTYYNSVEPSRIQHIKPRKK